MMINKHDTNGTKPLLGKGELGYDDYTAGGDTGRVYVGTGSENIPVAKKSEVLTVDGKADAHIARVDNPHGVTKAQVGLGLVDNTADASKNVLSATKWTAARTITLSGDIAGSASVDGSANVTIATTVQPNSVALGTDTTGNYVAGVTAGQGITISGTAGEGWSPTISITNVGTAGTYTKVTTNAQGQVTSGTTLSASDIPSLDASKITSGVLDAARLPAYVDDVLEFTNLAAFPVTGETGKIYVALDTNKTYRWSGSAYVYITSGAVDSVNGQTGVVNVTTITGNAGTATKLQTARTINGVSFDGSANISVNTNNSEIIKFDSGATEGTDLYTFNGSSAKTIDIKAGTNVTLTKAVGSITISANDTSVAWSEITSKPTTLSGYGITDAAPSSHVGATGTAHGNATTSVAGFMSNTDKTKLDGIATGANNYVHPTSGVASGSYAKVTVDANGHVTAGLVPTMEDIPDAAFKKSVRCATTGNLVATYASNVLTMSAVGVTVIDGVTIALNDRILVKDQTSTAHNGIYRVSTLGTASVATVFTRTTDADTSSEIAGAIVNVDSGTVNGGIAYTANFKTTDTLGTTGMPFYKLMYENGSWGISVTGSSASCTGNAATAATLQTARLIGGVSFNGSADITLPGVNTTGNQNTTGSAATLTTTRTFSATGDVTATAQNFNGSANVTLPMVLANSGVTAGTYSKVTVDAKGRVTAGLVPTMEDIPDATFKRSVRCATTANITLSGTQTIDGIAVVAGDRVLVKNQTTASQNGIYVVAAGAWTRALDANTSSKIASALVAVDSGTVNGGKLFDNDLKTTDALDTTSMVWSMNLDDASLLVSTSASIGTVRYNGTVAAAGQFDGGTTTPTGSNRLNYGGYFYPTSLNLVGTADTTAATTHVFVETGTDGFVRPKTFANFRKEIEDTLGTAIASAATTTVGTAGLGDYIHITGTTTITSLGTAASAGVRRTLIFDGALTLTHNATSLICPGAANIVTVAGTVIEVVAETTANWRVVSITHPSLSMEELGYLDGVTSAIQTQLNAKAALASPALTGTPTAPTAASTVSSTQIATTAFAVPRTSTTGSAVIPAGTTAQRDASPVDGMIRYNSTTRGFEGYFNGTWQSVGGGQMFGNVLIKNANGNTVTLQNPDTNLADVVVDTSNIVVKDSAGNVVLPSESKIQGDFSNATDSSKTLFQTSTVNGNTFINSVPNGTATISAFGSYNNSDVNNSSVGYLSTNSSAVRLISSNTGTGTVLPITFSVGETEKMRIDTSGNLLLKSGTGALGYGTGAGGIVVQLTSKSTAVTLNKPTGTITMNNAALAAGASVAFAFNNNLLSAQDLICLTMEWNLTTSYRFEHAAVGAGTSLVRVTNISGISLSEAVQIKFSIIKGANS